MYEVKLGPQVMSAVLLADVENTLLLVVQPTANRVLCVCVCDINTTHLVLCCDDCLCGHLCTAVVTRSHTHTHTRLFH